MRPYLKNSTLIARVILRDAEKIAFLNGHQ
jgi:hypothetical protein